MFTNLPSHIADVLTWEWENFAPFYDELARFPLNEQTMTDWIAQWSFLDKLISEYGSRLYVAITADTTDEAAQTRYLNFHETIHNAAKHARHQLHQKLLDSGLQPAGFELPLKNIQTTAQLFSEKNLPLFVEEKRLETDYDKIRGAQTVLWNGEELTIDQIGVILKSPDRAQREQAWRLAAQRQLDDRAALNVLWSRFMDVRAQIAANAGLPDYRAYKWLELFRYDYTPQDCAIFHRAIEEVAVPAAQRIYQKRCQRLGVESLRPWDVSADTSGQPPLKPFNTIDELEAKTETIFQQVDPALGVYFKMMRQEKLLDLDNRKGKAPGGYCTRFLVSQQPFIFMNAVGLHDDVQTLLHEGGHAFHVYESAHLWKQQLEVPTEFAEVASMGMELLAAPYLTTQYGGFYSAEAAKRARAEHLEDMILFWPYMAVVDAFQHWAYTNHTTATDSAACDAKWTELWTRFMKGVDWSGFEAALATGWQRKLHIFQVPFYYVEYGLAQIGAVQVWHNALKNQTEAVRQYRAALALGGISTLPQLYATAGARFAFDTPTMRQVVGLIEETLTTLDGA